MTDKPTLTVIKGAGASRRRERSHRGGFILPPVKIPDKPMYDEWLGLTTRQADLAFWAAMELNEGPAVAAFQRILKAHSELEDALDEYRQVLLAAMQARYPAAAKRIMRAAKGITRK